MKVLVLTSSYPVSDGSYEGGFVADLTRRIRAYEVVPVVLAPHFPGGLFKEYRNGILVYRFLYFFPLRFERLAYGAGLLFNIRSDLFAVAGIVPFCLMEFLWTLVILFRERVDIIHTHWFIPQGLIGALVHRMTGIPHVATVHGSDLSMLKKRAFLRSVCRFIVRNSTSITVNSTYMKRQLAEVVPESLLKIRIIPMGVEPAEFERDTGLNIRKDKGVNRIVLHVGRLIDWKGTVYLIDAMPDVVRHFPDAKLVIIGTGPEMDALQKKTGDTGMGEHVEFRGSVSHDDLVAAYHSADVFVLPSIELSGRTEGLGVVLLEAMASGCPVIGSNVGGVPDIISDNVNGFLVPEQDPVALAETIVSLLTDDVLAEQFRQAGYGTVKTRFSWDEISRQFSDMYRQVLGGYSRKGGV